MPLLKAFAFKVDFGHRTFRWTSEAPDAAAVHVVVIGFSSQVRPARLRLCDYTDINADPVVSVPSPLNAYLVDGADLAPVKLRAPLVAGMPMASKGSQPTDGGHLLVDHRQFAEVNADPVARKYLRRFVQGKDLLDGTPRWCLWLADAPPADLRGSAVLQRRLQDVVAARLESPTESVRAVAGTPALFTQRRQPSSRYFALPEVSSENREWIPGRSSSQT